MKIKQLATAALGALALCGGMAFESNKAQAQDYRFECSRHPSGGFVTYLTVGHWKKELITWNRRDFEASNWTPERRCQAVTYRLNYAVEHNIPLRLTTGRVNGYGVICALQGRQTHCSGNTFNLVTLTPGTDPREALITLVNAGNNASARPLAQSGSVTLNDWVNNARSSEN